MKNTLDMLIPYGLGLTPWCVLYICCVHCSTRSKMKDDGILLFWKMVTIYFINMCLPLSIVYIV